MTAQPILDVSIDPATVDWLRLTHIVEVHEGCDARMIRIAEQAFLAGFEAGKWAGRQGGDGHPQLARYLREERVAR